MSVEYDPSNQEGLSDDWMSLLDEGTQKNLMLAKVAGAPKPPKMNNRASGGGGGGGAASLGSMGTAPAVGGSSDALQAYEASKKAHEDQTAAEGADQSVAAQATPMDDAGNWKGVFDWKNKGFSDPSARQFGDKAGMGGDSGISGFQADYDASKTPVPKIDQFAKADFTKRDALRAEQQAAEKRAGTWGPVIAALGGTGGAVVSAAYAHVHSLGAQADQAERDAILDANYKNEGLRANAAQEMNLEKIAARQSGRGIASADSLSPGKTPRGAATLQVDKNGQWFNHFANGDIEPARTSAVTQTSYGVLAPEPGSWGGGGHGPVTQTLDPGRSVFGKSQEEKADKLLWHSPNAEGDVTEKYQRPDGTTYTAKTAGAGKPVVGKTDADQVRLVEQAVDAQEAKIRASAEKNIGLKMADMENPGTIDKYVHDQLIQQNAGRDDANLRKQVVDQRFGGGGTANTPTAAPADGGKKIAPKGKEVPRNGKVYVSNGDGTWTVKG